MRLMFLSIPKINTMYRLWILFYFFPSKVCVICHNPLRGETLYRGRTQLDRFYASHILERRWRQRTNTHITHHTPVETSLAALSVCVHTLLWWGTVRWFCLLDSQVCSVSASSRWPSGLIIGTSSMSISPTTRLQTTWVYVLDSGGFMKVCVLSKNIILLLYSDWVHPYFHWITFTSPWLG